MREIADEGGESDQREIAEWPEKNFYVVAEHKKKIQVANEMNGTGMKKECGEERQAVQTRCLRRNQSKLGDNFVERVKANALAAMIAVHSIHVAHGLRACGTASNSIGIPKNAAIPFHHSSGGLLSKSVPRACSASCCTLASAIASRAFCGSSGFGGGKNRGTRFSTSAASNQTKWQRRQTSTLIPASSESLTSVIGFRHAGQLRPVCPSPRTA